MPPRPLRAALVSSLFATGALAACVGADPAPTTAGGVDAATALDSGGGADSRGGGTDSGGATDSLASVDASAPDAGPGDAGDADAGAWSPRSLPGLALWLEGATGVTYDGSSKATSWLDQSGNGNNATLLSPCAGPSRAAASLAGRDTLAFDGTQAGGTCMAVADSASIQFGAGDFAVFVVARYSNIPGITEAKPSATFWAKREQASPFRGVWLVGNTLSESKLQLWQQNLTGNQAISARAGLNDSTFHRFGGTRRGLAFEAWVDGMSEANVALPNADNVSQVGRPLFIGGSPELPKGWLSGNIAEVVGIKGVLTNGQISQLDSYFKNKHGL